VGLKAKEVLADCAVALEDFEQSAATAYWRTRWVAVVTLLRAVGNVLESVDAKSNEAAAAAIAAEYNELKRTKPQPEIYWRFILEERNSVVKEMALGAHLSITLRPGTAWWDARTGETGGLPGLPTTFDHFMRGGVYDSKDPRELCRMAIAFWSHHLDRVEERIAEASARAAV